jgi:hypothetical protein
MRPYTNLKRCTNLEWRVTSEARRAVERGNQPWIQAHVPLAAFVENQTIPLSGRYRRRNLVFYRIRDGQYARRYVRPRDPRTPAQRRVRALLGALSRQWRLLTQAQQWAWVGVAEVMLSRRRLDRGPLTGQLLFHKLNFVLRLVGREPLEWPVRREVFRPNPVGELKIQWEHGQLRLKLRRIGPMADDIMVYGEAPVSARRTKPRHPLYLGVLPSSGTASVPACAASAGRPASPNFSSQVPASAGRWFDITDWYVARFGVPEAGKKVILCTQQQRNGWTDWAMNLSAALVPARVGKGRRPRAAGRKPATPPEAREKLMGLNELLGLPGLQDWPRVPHPAPAHAFGLRTSDFALRTSSPSPRCPLSDTAIPRALRDHYESTPMCIVQPPVIAAPYEHTPRFPFHASRFPLPAASATHRKCHRRSLWRGT